MQAARLRRYRRPRVTRSKDRVIKTEYEDVNVWEVVDLQYASLIVVDEIHLAGSDATITYNDIIQPFLCSCRSGRPLGILGITGLALSSGLGLVMTFAQRACLLAINVYLDDLGVQALRAYKGVDNKAAWKVI